LGEVVAVIRVAHQDETPTSGGDAASQCASVTACIDEDHSRADCGSNFPGAIRASIVGDDYLSVDCILFYGVDRLSHAHSYRGFFVQARHHNGKLDSGVVMYGWFRLMPIRSNGYGIACVHLAFLACPMNIGKSRYNLWQNLRRGSGNKRWVFPVCTQQIPLKAESNTTFTQDGSVITTNTVYNNGQAVSQNISVLDAQGKAKTKNVIGGKLLP
jgi:hypothetical protein